MSLKGSERFRWRERAQSTNSQKKDFVLSAYDMSLSAYRSTMLHAEWFPRLNVWRAIRMVTAMHCPVGMLRLTPHCLAEFPCAPELRDFVLAEVMVFLEVHHELSQDHTGVAAAPEQK